jgi:pilus assembly protein CpaE
MSSIVLATSSAAFEQKVRRALGFDVDRSVERRHSENMFVDPLVAAKQLTVGTPDIIAIGPNVDVEVALDITMAIEVERPEIDVILIADSAPNLWKRAMHAGVSDVLRPDANDEQIRTSFNRVIETAERRRRNLVVEAGVPDFAGRVVTVISPKGGVGKTAVTTNLAVALALGESGRVVLLDLDLQFGDVSTALGIEPENTIADLARIPGGVTPTSLKVFMTRRTENLYVLCAPASPADEVSEAVVNRVIRLLADEFDSVVIDTAAGLQEATLTAIDLSTDLVLLCDLSASALRGLRKVVDALDNLGITEPTRHFVLNKANDKVGITPDDAAAIVGMKVDIEIPSSQTVPLSMNYGNLVLEEAPDSAVAQGFRSVAGLFVDMGADRKKRFTFGRSR